jgi:hypothetical protein
MGYAARFLPSESDMSRSVYLVLLVLLPAIASAQDQSERTQPLQELFFTEVVYPQSRHELQLTFGSLVDRTREDKSALVPFSIEFGLTDRLQVEAAWHGYSHFHSSPLTHLTTARWTVGAKYSLMNIKHSPLHAAVGIEVEFPRSGAFSEGEGETDTEFEPFLALAADIGHDVTIFGSGGLSIEAGQVKELLTSKERPDDKGTVSFGALVRLRRITLVGEYTSRSDQAPWRLDGSPLVTPSIVVHPGGQWELGFGLPIGVRMGTHKPGLAMHLVKEF